MIRSAPQLTKLERVCSRITVGHVGPMASEYVNEGIPFLRSQNIEPFRVRLDEVKFINAAFHAKLSKSALRPGDVAVIRTGYPGVAAVIPSGLADSNCADLVVITPLENLLDSHYLAAIFNSTWGKATVAGNLVGVAQQHFNVGAARNLELSLPPVSLQRRIVGILRAYDDLIENCERRIRVLDEMARGLYREWFLNFRYPGHEKVPLVESTRGAMPRGWVATCLGELAVNFDRLRRPLSGAERLGRAGPYPYYGAAKVFDHIDGYIFDGEYLLLAEDGSVTTSEGLPVLQLANGKFWANNHTHVLQGRPPVSTKFLYLATSMASALPFVSGAAQPKITQENMNRIPLIRATNQLHTQFDAVVGPWIEMGALLLRRIANLRATRDHLLPRLLSGELPLADAAA